MRKVYKASATNLSAFNNLLLGQYAMTQGKLIDKIMGIKVKSYQMSTGSLIHAYIEDGIKGDVLCTRQEEVKKQAVIDEITLKQLADQQKEVLNEYIAQFKGIDVKVEEKLPKMICYHPDYDFLISTRLDLLLPSSVRDVKTSKSAYSYNIDAFHSSPQWKLYLKATGRDFFVYDHFQVLKDRLRYEEDVKIWEDDYDQDIEDLVVNYVSFAKVQGIEKYIEYNPDLEDSEDPELELEELKELA